MGWTKRQFVEAAFEEIGIASYSFDLMPEQLDSALRRLDAMLATWNARGLRLGYPLPSRPQNSDLDEDTNVPDSANEAIITNLAIRLAPGLGKAVSGETRGIASASYDSLLNSVAMPNEMSFPGTLPSGAGNRRRQSGEFIIGPAAPVLAGGDGEVILE